MSESDITDPTRPCNRSEIVHLSAYPGYGVSAEGRVWSLPRWGRRCLLEMKPAPNQDGYPTVRMRIAKREVKQTVHKLIAAAFLPPQPTPRHEVRHLNGNINDPSAGNLAWGTQKENADDRERHGRTAKGERVSLAKLNEDSVREIRRLRREGLPLLEIAARFGVSDVAVSYVCKRKTWKHVA